jgi:hypothetical protein
LHRDVRRVVVHGDLGLLLRRQRNPVVLEIAAVGEEGHDRVFAAERTGSGGDGVASLTAIVLESLPVMACRNKKQTNKNQKGYEQIQILHSARSLTNKVGARLAASTTLAFVALGAAGLQAPTYADWRPSDEEGGYLAELRSLVHKALVAFNWPPTSMEPSPTRNAHLTVMSNLWVEGSLLTLLCHCLVPRQSGQTLHVSSSACTQCALGVLSGKSGLSLSGDSLVLTYGADESAFQRRGS